MIDFLAKIQAEYFINDMYKNEYLYFKFHKDFRSQPGNEMDSALRYDSREGNLLHRQVSEINLSTEEGNKVRLSRGFPESHAEYTERLQEPLINNCSLTKISFDNNLKL